MATRRDGTRIDYRLAGPDAAAARDTYLGPDDVEQVTCEELLRRAETGEVVVLDVRPVEAAT